MDASLPAAGRPFSEPPRATTIARSSMAPDDIDRAEAGVLQPAQLVAERARLVVAGCERDLGVLRRVGDDHIGQDKAPSRGERGVDAVEEIGLLVLVEVMDRERADDELEAPCGSASCSRPRTSSTRSAGSAAAAAASISALSSTETSSRSSSRASSRRAVSPVPVPSSSTRPPCQPAAAASTTCSWNSS